MDKVYNAEEGTKFDKSNKKVFFNHPPIRRGDKKKSNYARSHQNPTISEYRLMHQIRKILSNIGTSIASLEYACWAVVRMLYMF